jgi:hypothetical protein
MTVLTMIILINCHCNRIYNRLNLQLEKIWFCSFQLLVEESLTLSNFL